jgi:alpha-L-fucosidase
VLVAFRQERDRIFSKDLAQGAKVRYLEEAPYSLFRPGHGPKNVLDTAYHTYWAALTKKAMIDIVLDSFTTFDIIVIQEYIPLGQRVYDVQFAINEGDGMYCQTTLDHPLCTTVGHKRIIRLEESLGYTVRTDRIILTFRGYAPPVINRIALYNSKAQ